MTIHYAFLEHILQPNLFWLGAWENFFADNRFEWCSYDKQCSGGTRGGPVGYNPPSGASSLPPWEGNFESCWKRFSQNDIPKMHFLAIFLASLLEALSPSIGRFLSPSVKQMAILLWDLPLLGQDALLKDRTMANGKDRFCLLHYSINHVLRPKKVLWRSGVILWLWSQNSQMEWVRAPLGPHHWSVMTRGHGLD